MNERQRIAWLVAVAQQSMADRNVSTLDGEAIQALLAAAGQEHADAAALAIQQLTGAEQ